MNKFIAIGVMSGTSLDGLDLACVEFVYKNVKWDFSILKTQTVPFDQQLLKEITLVLGKDISDNRSSLDLAYAKWVGKCINAFKSDLEVRIDLIASHGQTIFHDPSQNLTIQIGDGQTIANCCEIPVVNDFRSEDVSLGGHGAPLVPVGDLMLFPEYKYCLNLGGIANISEKLDTGISAFDICICNIAANDLASKFDLQYDKAGKLGSKGKLIDDLYKYWNELSYFSKKGPKSLDAGFYEKHMKQYIQSDNIEDVLRTLYEHIAFQVSRQITHLDNKVLVTGGGAYNTFLIDLMKEKFNLNVILPSNELIEFKEALIFAFLGILRVRNEINVLSQVTGSEADHSAGSIYNPEE